MTVLAGMTLLNYIIQSNVHLLADREPQLSLLDGRDLLAHQLILRSAGLNVHFRPGLYISVHLYVVHPSDHRRAYSPPLLAKSLQYHLFGLGFAESWDLLRLFFGAFDCR